VAVITSLAQRVAELTEDLGLGPYDPTNMAKNNGAVVEFHSPADKINNPTLKTETQKKQPAGAPGAQKTPHGPKNPGEATPEDATVDAVVNEALLSAGELLAPPTALSTGTPELRDLVLQQAQLDALAPLREFKLSPLHLRLQVLAGQLQQAFGTRAAWPNAPQVHGYFAVLSPVLLSSHLADKSELADFADEEAAELFTPLEQIGEQTTLNGYPVWDRFEWEQVVFFNLFKLYRDMRYTFYNEVDQLLAPRSMSKLAQAAHVEPRVVSYLSKLYLWQWRCELYDEWMERQQTARQLARRNLTLDRHSKIGRGLVQKAYNALLRQADKLTPKDALAMLELGLKYERLSLGLPGDKPEVTPSQSNGRGATVNIVNQTNNGNGAVAVAAPQQQLDDNLKKPDTLLSVLAVLQRSNAFSTLLQNAQDTTLLPEEPIVVDVAPAEEVSDKEKPAAEDPVEKASQASTTPGTTFTDLDGLPRGFADV
jgi:hypothetical protein